ncbi:MAG: type II toxin-antitoxin system VapC family toxin [Propionibacteriaceae bacterium]|nr:type II toxin-antitoxin system VapC family toxin [Propionibacteriaceae bacterium]
MILVDTSVWIDHLHHEELSLTHALENDQVVIHPLVIAELAMGSIAGRDEVLSLLNHLRRSPVLDDDEFHEYVNNARLWGRGLNLVDVHLLGSVNLLPDGQLWTRDLRLIASAREQSITLFPSDAFG